MDGETMSNLGMGVMIGMLSGNEKSVEAWNNSVGKEITALALRDDALHFEFADGFKMRLADEGQSCCESRYMRTDDDLSYHIGATLVKIEVRDAPSIPHEYGDHEVAFCDVTTSRGVFQMATHNEHNGYYGGFWIQLAAE
jgi:hypothetical protein